MPKVQVYIQNKGILYEPRTEEGIIWTTERKGVPGKLTLSVLKEGALNFQEGNAIRADLDGKPFFYGFVFTKKRTKGKLIQVIAYDQLRYFKNKDTYIYKNKTASELLQMMASDFHLQCGNVEDTGHKIKKRLEDNKTLFDIIQYALDETLKQKRRLYVLYDNVGKLDLRDVESMKVDMLVHANVAEDFEYSSSIDESTYNKIKLLHDNDESGKQEVYIAQDGAKINDWGVLQYTEKVTDKASAASKAESLLKLYNRKTRHLRIKGCFGDIRIHAGVSVPVTLSLGDIIANTYMICETVKHSFYNDVHSMEFTLIGGDFVA